ncbi:ankyrin repeat and death domain-containing protein 1B [Biomphalaria glabrata]|nr:ankyrin repeat and death domain-containing protein 1B-like [Biomphalaria glabrata]
MNPQTSSSNGHERHSERMLSVRHSGEKIDSENNIPLNVQETVSLIEAGALKIVAKNATETNFDIKLDIQDTSLTDAHYKAGMHSAQVSDLEKENVFLTDALYEFYQVVDEGYPQLIEEVACKYNIDVNTVFSDKFHFVKRKHRGWTALHVAASLGNVRTVRFLITAGCDIEAVTPDGETAVHIAAKHGAVDVLSYLLECNVFLRDRQNNQGGTALLKAIINSQQAFKGNYRRCVDILLGAGCNPNIYSSSKVTALHVAVDKGDYHLVSKLINAGANVNALCDRGTSPLLRALVSKIVHTDIVHALLLAGADTSLKANGRSLLHIAVARCDDRVIETFLQCKADPNCQDKSFKTPLWVAVEENNITVVPILVAGGGDVNYARPPQNISLLSQAVVNGSLPMVKLLLQHGATTYSETCMWSTPLHYAVELQNIEIIRELLRVNCPLNTTSNAQYSLRPMTPVQLALELGNVEIIYLLIQAGSRVQWSWLRPDRLSVAMSSKPDAVSHLHKLASQIPSLLHLSRLQLREYLGERFTSALHWMRVSGVVPNKIASYIAMSDMLD